MTDGTTGFQVAPITEDDMSRVNDILRRAADAIVGMSQLKADVDMLRQTVSGLQADTDRLRTQNANLDEALAHVRAERDQARADHTTASARANDAEVARDSLRNQVNDLGFELSSIKDELAQTIRERDEYGLQCLNLEDTNKVLQAKLDKIEAAHRLVFGAEPSPAVQPEPKPESVPQAQPPLGYTVMLNPAPLRTYHGTSWSSGYMWDDQHQEYYTEDASF